MPRPMAAGVFGMARITLPPQTSPIVAMVVPAMIETTSVEGEMNDFSCGPASANICGFTARTSTSTVPMSLAVGLRRTPRASKPRVSSDGFGSTTATRLASSPCTSQPDSMALPIFPAPARRMVP